MWGVLEVHQPYPTLLCPIQGTLRACPGHCHPRCTVPWPLRVQHMTGRGETPLPPCMRAVAVCSLLARCRSGPYPRVCIGVARQGGEVSSPVLPAPPPGTADKGGGRRRGRG